MQIDGEPGVLFVTVDANPLALRLLMVRLSGY